MNEIESKQTVDERAQKLLNTFGNIDTELPFIPALRVGQPLSGVVSGGKCQPGEFFYNQDTVLGESIPGLVYDYQWHGLKLKKKEKVLESYTVEYGEVDGVRQIVGDEVFVKIMRGKDDSSQGISYLWGPEILVFLPSINKFAKLFLNKKTNRRYWNEFLNPHWYSPTEPRLCKFFTTRVQPEGSTYVWWEPHCCLEEDVPEGFALPSRNRVGSAREKFRAKASEETPEDGEAPPER
jgi:hypothetical protein